MIFVAIMKPMITSYTQSTVVTLYILMASTSKFDGHYLKIKDQRKCTHSKMFSMIKTTHLLQVFPEDSCYTSLLGFEQGCWLL
jgi:hypothetical protein